MMAAARRKTYCFLGDLFGQHPVKLRGYHLQFLGAHFLQPPAHILRFHDFG